MDGFVCISLLAVNFQNAFYNFCASDFSITELVNMSNISYVLRISGPVFNCPLNRGCNPDYPIVCMLYTDQ